MNVVDIGDARIKRADKKHCLHQNMEYCMNTNIIHCEDCDNDLDPFVAFVSVCRYWDMERNKFDAREHAIEELEGKQLIFKSAKQLESLWRQKRRKPACPHCGEVISPQDGFKTVYVQT